MITARRSMTDNGLLRFDPATVLALTGAPLALRSAAEESVNFDEQSGLWLIPGAATVGQACCDPHTFAAARIPREPASAAPVGLTATMQPAARWAAGMADARVQAVLRMAWPTTAGRADLLWRRRVRVHVAQAAAALTGRAADAPGGVPDGVQARPGVGSTPVDGLTRAVIESVFGISAGTIDEVRAVLDCHAHRSTTAAESAALPLSALHELVGRIVRERAAEPVDVLNPAQPDTVLDDVLICRGRSADRLTLDEITGASTSLLAAAWDATAELLPRVLDAVRSLRRRGDRFRRTAAPLASH
ncbi:hypothetical protein [Dactylosporangium siamense]